MFTCDIFLGDSSLLATETYINVPRIGDFLGLDDDVLDLSYEVTKVYKRDNFH